MTPAAAPLTVEAPVSGGVLEITTTASERAWDRFVHMHPDASGYHTWKWRRVFEEAFGHDTVYLSAHQDGEIVGVLPLVVFRSPLFGRFGVSLPFVNYGGVCARDVAVARALAEAAVRIAAERRLSHIELRHTTRQRPDLPARQHKVGMYLALERDAGRAWEGLDRKVRNQVRKAEKSGCTAEDGGAELLGDFYRVFAHNMRDLGTPVYGRRFFDEVLRAFPGDTRVFVVRVAGEPVAASITVGWRDRLEVPWASSLREYRSQCPNNLLYWRIIEHATESGCRSLDFGRSTPNEGTYHFKAQWGARPEPLYWEYVLRGRSDLPDLSPANPKYRAAIAVWTRLPLAITNFVGPYIVKSIP